MKRTALLAVALLPALAGCADGALFATGPSVATGTPPIVRSTDRGTAMLTIIACPLQAGGAAILTEYLQSLQTASPVVTADSRATSRLIINLCPSPPDAEMIRAVSTLQRRR